VQIYRANSRVCTHLGARPGRRKQPAFALDEAPFPRR